MEEKDKALDGKESEIESVDLLHLYEELEEKQKTIQYYETQKDLLRFQLQPSVNI